MSLVQSWNRTSCPKILILGDIMLDRYTWGDPERISPEAPVLIVREDDTESRPGGAANVASFVATLGAEVLLAGVIGADPDGEDILKLMTQRQVDTTLVVPDVSRRTTSKHRLIGRGPQRQPQQIVRVDREERSSVAIEIECHLSERLLASIPLCDVVLVADHGKGVCTPGLLRRVIDSAARHGVPVLIDPSQGVDYQRYARATVLAPNRIAAERAFIGNDGFNLAQYCASQVLSATNDSSSAPLSLHNPSLAKVATEYLRQRLELEAAIVTLDKNGLAFATHHDFGVVPCRAREVCDVTAAGDMVLSVLGLCWHAGIPLTDSLKIANAAAGLEVERFGAVPLTRTEIAAELEQIEGSTSISHIVGKAPSRLVSIQNAIALVKQMQSTGKTVVVTNGCFDLLHRGHAHLLAFARAQGDALFVALNSDDSVKRLKGPTRPVWPLEHRIEMLDALRAVNYIVSFETDTPTELLAALKPDVLVKGEDYAGRPIAGSEHCGRVVLAPLLPGISTSVTIDSIQATPRNSSAEINPDLQMAKIELDAPTPLTASRCSPATHFSHSGDCGDLIYHLSAIRAMGAGHLTLYPSGMTTSRMSPERAENLRRLLEAQPYILSVQYADAPQGLNLDCWRWHCNGHLNLSDTLHSWLHLEHWPRTQPWLEAIEPRTLSPVVFCRTERYNNRDFPWHAVYRKYVKDAIFIGLPEQHRAFVEEFGPVPYVPTIDLYEAARIVTGSQLVVVNQTSVRAIAEGLKKRVLVEVAPFINNTHFERPDAYYGYDQGVELPDIT